MSSYEEKMKRLAQCRPENKDKYLLALLKGEKIDTTKDEDLFFQINKDRMSMNDFVNRDRFLQDKKEFKVTKDHLHDVKHGKTPDGKGRLLGEIPAEIYYGRKELSDPTIPRHEREKAIRKFFNDFPAFKAGTGRL